MVAIASRVFAGLESPILAARELRRFRFQVGVAEDDTRGRVDWLREEGNDSQPAAASDGLRWR